jgi:hypothetical protein
MTGSAQQNDTLLAASDGDDKYIHIVGDIQHWLDRLHLKVPRALCGASLVGDPDKPGPGFNAPICPRCEARNR